MGAATAVAVAGYLRIVSHFRIVKIFNPFLIKISIFIFEIFINRGGRYFSVGFTDFLYHGLEKAHKISRKRLKYFKAPVQVFV